MIMIMRIVLVMTPVLFLSSTVPNLLITENLNILLNQDVYAQLGISPGEILLNDTGSTIDTTNTTAGENNTTTAAQITPAPEVNNTLIGRSTPTTAGNLSAENINEDNNTGEAEPIGGIK
jgi:hypothetical protein